MLLERTSCAADSSAGADTCYKHIYFTFRVAPNLLTCRRVVDSGIGRIDELPEDDASRRLFAQLFCLADCTLHAFRTRREHQLRAIYGQQLTPLDAHRLRHW